MNDVTVHRLEENWNKSREAPYTLFESGDPQAKVGSFVIEPGERVPETGTTSHEGDEITVILTGEIDLVVGDERMTAGPETMMVTPAGTPHYSVNAGDEPVRLVYMILGEL